MKKIAIRLLPLISLLISWLMDVLIRDSELHPIVEKPYYCYFLSGLGIIYAVCIVLAIKSKKIAEKIDYKAVFIAGAIQLINIINLITVKFVLLPVLYFPSLDAVFKVFAVDYELLIKCILSSFRLLIMGFAYGSVLGFFTGLFIGFNKHANYWISPLTRVLGPIPSTSWSPLVLSIFATSYDAAVFLVALAVWFPITLMTSSGIQNVKISYFEVASTLGANSLYKIFKVGVPASMPHIFMGIFYATCSSFVTLVTAEMFGCESGIGWYLNWGKSLMLYSNVYAGLIVLAGICCIVITLIFKLKDRILTWQKGVIKW